MHGQTQIKSTYTLRYNFCGLTTCSSVVVLASN